MVAPSISPEPVANLDVLSVSEKCRSHIAHNRGLLLPHLGRYSRRVFMNDLVFSLRYQRVGGLLMYSYSIFCPPGV